jgi:rod shape-determining protein MreC
MTVHAHHSKNWGYVTALSWQSAVQRFSFVFFLILSFGLLVLGRTNPPLVQSTRAHIVDGIAPVLSAVTRPMEMVERFTQRLNSYATLQEDNEKLRAQNAQLALWQNAVVALDHENKELRGLLHFKAEPSLAYISARVIADTGGPFVRALIITAGHAEGVKEGMAAMTGEGLIGRVVEVSDRSSRVLLLSDLSSRIPVVVAGSGDHAILAGDNSAQPKLLYLPQDAALENGARVLTSGHGGVFPPNLPVGLVEAKDHGVYSVVPLASLGRISYVQLVDFNLAGGPSNPIANKLANNH